MRLSAVFSSRRPSPVRGSWRSATLLLALAVVGASCTDRPDPIAPPAPGAEAGTPLGTSNLATYRIQSIPGARFAWGVNDRGQVVGMASTTSQSSGWRAFVWTAETGLRLLGDFGPSNSTPYASEAYAINNQGQIVGTGSHCLPFGGRAFIWDEANGIRSLGLLPNMMRSSARDIDEHGHVVGESSAGAGPCEATRTSRGFFWTPEGGMQDLGDLGGAVTEARAMNDRHQVVGISNGRAFLWTAEAGMRDLGVLPGMAVSIATDINNLGHVVGTSTSSDGRSSRAFRWTPEGGMQDLGDFFGPKVSAQGINDRGEIIGSGATSDELDRRPFRWTEATGMQDLGAPEGVRNAAVFDLNEVGQIVGYALGATVWSASDAPPPPPPAGETVSLVSALSGTCMDVAGGSREPGTPVTIWPCHGGDPQRFTLPAAGTTGEIRVYDGTLCLDDAGAQGQNGDAIIIWHCTGGQGQQWRHTAQGELRGINDRCIDVAGWNSAPGTRLLLWDCHGGENQRWTATTSAPPPPSGAVMLVNEHSGLCLDVAGDNRNPGTQLILWDCHGGAPQRWTLPANGGPGNISVYDATGRLCLDDAGGRGENGDAIATWTCHGDAPQQWTLTSDGLLQGINGKCVDAEAWGTAPGTRLILWDCHGGANQRWRVRRE